MKFMPRLLFITSLVFASAFADPITYDVSLDTSSLVGSVAGPFWLDFELTDGSATGDGNNTGVLSDFQFGSGGAIGSPISDGGASGDVLTEVMLIDSSAFGNGLDEMFTPGNSLSFQLQLSTNVDAGGADSFSFSILDSTFTPLPTTAGFPIDALAVINIDNSVSPTVETFAGDTSRSIAAGGNPIAIAAPVIAIVSADVPEPSALPLLLIGLAAIATKRRVLG